MKASTLTVAALIGLFGLTGCTGQSTGASSAPADPPAATPSASASASGAAGAESTDAAAAPATDAALPPAPQTAQAVPPAAGPSELTEGKARFTGDYSKATPADSAKIAELAKQWHSAEKEALFHEKMDGSGLSATVPPEQAETFYGRAAEACQRRFDGYKPPLEGAALEIENLALSVYCPGLG